MKGIHRTFSRPVPGSLRIRLLLTFGVGSVVLFVLIRLISFTGIPWLNITGERDLYIAAAEQNLNAIADEKKETVLHWFQERLGDGRTVVAFPAFRHHVALLSAEARQKKGAIWGNLTTEIHYRSVLERIRIVDRSYGQYDVISVVDLSSGICLVSSDESDAGSFLPYARELLADRGGAWNEKIFFSRDDHTNKTFLYMAFVVRNIDEKPVAALVFRIEPETFLVRLFHQSPALGDSGEIILIDMQRTLLTPLKYKLSDGAAAEPLLYVLQTKPAEMAALGIDSLFSSRDYRDVPILAAVRHLRITPDFGFGLIVKRDEREVYEPIRQSMTITGAVTGLGIVCLLVLGAFAARTIARPVEDLTDAARKIAGGDLQARAAEIGKDEISELSHAFNAMAERIQQSHELLEQLVAERTEELTASNQLLRVEIEERRKADALLRESEMRFRQVAENIPEVFWLGATDWKSIDYISPAYERIWGQLRDDLYANPLAWLDAVVRDDRESVMNAIPTAVTAGEMVVFPDYRIRRPDGTIRWISARAFPVEDEKGNPYRVAGIAEDITERKHLEIELVQAQKMESVGRLAGGVAHDFNNMLAIIFISLELARMNLAEHDPVREQLNDIEKAATHSRDITRQLLAFSRKQLISPRPCNLNTLIANLEKSLGRLIGEDIELHFYPDQELGDILIDPSQVDQVLVNLAVNARDAMPHGGKLTIATANVFVDEAYCEEHSEAHPGRYVTLSVSDDGVGMDKETLEHIFEPFFTTKDVGKGTGLGLAMIYGIIRQNDGFVNVYSEPGHGTSFKLYFPRLEDTAHLIEGGETASPEKGTAHILLVEDDAMLCRVTKATLETLGYTVTATQSPAEALALLEQARPGFALLLTDVVMPGMNGRELAERIAAQCHGIRVVFMSGHTTDAVVHRGVLEDGVHFLQKPFSVKALASKVREALEQK